MPAIRSRPGRQGIRGGRGRVGADFGLVPNWWLSSHRFVGTPSPRGSGARRLRVLPPDWKSYDPPSRQPVCSCRRPRPQASPTRYTPAYHRRRRTHRRSVHTTAGTVKPLQICAVGLGPAGRSNEQGSPSHFRRPRRPRPRQ